MDGSLAKTEPFATGVHGCEKHLKQYAGKRALPLIMGREIQWSWQKAVCSFAGQRFINFMDIKDSEQIDPF